MGGIMPAIIIENVLHSQLSIARFSGGARINGVDYIYVPHRDILVQHKYWKQYEKLGYEKFKKFIQNGEEEIKTDRVNRPREKKANPQVSKGLFETGDMSPF